MVLRAYLKGVFFIYLRSRRKLSHADYFRKNEHNRWEFNIGRWIDDETTRNAQIAEVERLYFLAKEHGFSDYVLSSITAKFGNIKRGGVLMAIRTFRFSDKIRPHILKALKELEKDNFNKNKKG